LTASKQLWKKRTNEGDSLKLMEKQKKENPLFSLIQLNVMDGKIGRGPLIGLVHSKDTAWSIRTLIETSERSSSTRFRTQMERKIT
jgi:hypothetical protein